MDIGKDLAKAYQDGYETAKAEIIGEIFKEVKVEITASLDSNYKAIRDHNEKHFPNTDASFLERVYGKIDALRGIDGFIDELEKKYTEETNE